MIFRRVRWNRSAKYGPIREKRIVCSRFAITLVDGLLDGPAHQLAERYSLRSSLVHGPAMESVRQYDRGSPLHNYVCIIASGVGGGQGRRGRPALLSQTSTRGARQLYGFCRISSAPSPSKSASLASCQSSPVASTVVWKFPFPSPYRIQPVAEGLSRSGLLDHSPSRQPGYRACRLHSRHRYPEYGRGSDRGQSGRVRSMIPIWRDRLCIRNTSAARFRHPVLSRSERNGRV